MEIAAAPQYPRCSKSEMSTKLRDWQTFCVRRSNRPGRPCRRACLILSCGSLALDQPGRSVTVATFVDRTCSLADILAIQPLVLGHQWRTYLRSVHTGVEASSAAVRPSPTKPPFSALAPATYCLKAYWNHQSGWYEIRNFVCNRENRSSVGDKHSVNRKQVVGEIDRQGSVHHGAERHRLSAQSDATWHMQTPRRSTGPAHSPAIRCFTLRFQS